MVSIYTQLVLFCQEKIGSLMGLIRLHGGSGLNSIVFPQPIGLSSALLCPSGNFVFARKHFLQKILAE
jgi:hypothetical protein